MDKILVTGGAGYIGSHTCVELLEAGYEVVVVDNLSNASEEALKRVQKLTGKRLSFYKVDLLNKDALRDVFEKEGTFHSVIHMAAYKGVGESVKHPLIYYYNNIVGALNLFDVMKERDVRQIIFSSSATVYGKVKEVPIAEGAAVDAINPYGHTKVIIEQVLNDIALDHGWKCVMLRYFNPLGAHASGEIGEDPEYLNNLVPLLCQVAVGSCESVTIFGTDYPTPDGTGVRDYVHVVDLAQAHVKALEKLSQTDAQSLIYNLGSGKGYSVKEVISTFCEISGIDIPVVIKDRREGDMAECVADTALAASELEWTAQYDLEEMIRSAWKWQKQNPRGYDK